MDTMLLAKALKVVCLDLPRLFKGVTVRNSEKGYKEAMKVKLNYGLQDR